MRKYRLLSLPVGKDPSEWTARERRLFDIQMQQFQKDNVFLDTLGNDLRYDEKWVCVFRGQVIAAGKNHGRVLRKVERLGGPELRGRSAFTFISSRRTIFILLVV